MTQEETEHISTQKNLCFGKK